MKFAGNHNKSHVLKFFARKGGFGSEKIPAPWVGDPIVAVGVAADGAQGPDGLGCPHGRG